MEINNASNIRNPWYEPCVVVPSGLFTKLRGENISSSYFLFNSFSYLSVYSLASISGK